jgi:hypothetical protein
VVWIEPKLRGFRNMPDGLAGENAKGAPGYPAQALIAQSETKAVFTVNAGIEDSGA